MSVEPGLQHDGASLLRSGLIRGVRQAGTSSTFSTFREYDLHYIQFLNSKKAYYKHLQKSNLAWVLPECFSPIQQIQTSRTSGSHTLVHNRLKMLEKSPVTFLEALAEYASEVHSITRKGDLKTCLETPSAEAIILSC